MRRLLVVDDEEHIRLLCRRAAARHAVEVHEAARAEEALALLASTSFDCVLSDYRMGVLTGVDVLEAALLDQPSAARVLMSSFADDAVLEAARRRARIHGFFEKPLLARDFEAALRHEVLERYGAFRAPAEPGVSDDAPRPP